MFRSQTAFADKGRADGTVVLRKNVSHLHFSDAIVVSLAVTNYELDNVASADLLEPQHRASQVDPDILLNGRTRERSENAGESGKPNARPVTTETSPRR